MNKTDMTEYVAQYSDLSKAASQRAIEAVTNAIKMTLKKGGTVTIVGFGTFHVANRAARAGRNPRTGQSLKIKAARNPKFRPSKALKNALN